MVGNKVILVFSVSGSSGSLVYILYMLRCAHSYSYDL